MMIARNALRSVGVVGAGLAGQQLGTVLGGILGAPLGLLVPSPALVLDDSSAEASALR